jgi:hypothetical protein
MKDLILLNNLFNGEYIKEKVGGEIINIYQSDNGKYYIYVNPYGNVNKKWDNRIKHILFIRSVGNGVVKVIGKAEIKEQICLEGVFKKDDKKIDTKQKKYIDANDIKYGGAKICNLGSWSRYYITFESEGIYNAKTDIYLSPNEIHHYPINSTFVLENIGKINNQSQKLYIESSNINYEVLEEILQNPNFWKKDKVGKVDLSENKANTESFLSIIKKENDELVNSNLLAYFLENDRTFWSDFVEKVLEISNDNIINGNPKITRESVGNIDLLIEVGGCAIIIENKIKSGINGQKNNGYSQLEKYVKIAGEYFKNSNRTLYFYVLRPDYNNEDYTVFNEGNRYSEIKYSKILEIIENRNAGLYFEEFKRVVKKHSAEYDNELFELMNDRFIEQIRSKQ